MQVDNTLAEPRFFGRFAMVVTDRLCFAIEPMVALISWA
jgi:hypothetical protein